jgi:hypothetical protein
MSECFCRDYDVPAFYVVALRKARKQHKCYECRNVIDVGETYELASGSWDGYPPQSYKTCARCLDLRHQSCGADTPSFRWGRKRRPFFGFQHIAERWSAVRCRTKRQNTMLTTTRPYDSGL